MAEGKETLTLLSALCSSRLGGNISAEDHHVYRLTPKEGDGAPADQPATLVLAKLSAAEESTLAEAESLKAMHSALSAAREAVREGKEMPVLSPKDAQDGSSEVAWGMVPCVYASGVTCGEDTADQDSESASIFVPGVRSGRAFLVCDYKDLSGGLSPGRQRQLGHSLALMHKYGPSPNGQYGFKRRTWCGMTDLDNSWNSSWSKFWANQRIGPLVQEIESKIKPSILHGDLWSGNAGSAPISSDSNTLEAVFYDPASYYGHSEADLGMMHMFGGFTKDCFDAYHEILPRLQPHYNQRVKLYELYHHLNHGVLFGWGYMHTAKSMMHDLVLWAKKETEKA